MSHNNQKKIAIINDISGFGRCSIAVSLPIISHMRIQGCMLPTSIFSNHTGFESFFYDDYTDKMTPYMQDGKNWIFDLKGLPPDFWALPDRLRSSAILSDSFRMREPK